MKYLIAGAGYTGLSVAKQLQGEKVTLLSRSFNNKLEFDSQKIDLDKDDFTISITSPFVVLYTIPPNTASLSDERLKLFLKKLKINPNRIVYLSSSGVYGDRKGNYTDETVKPNPITKRAIRRLNAEKCITDWCHKNKVEHVILRVSGIYGPDRLGIEKLRQGLTVIKQSKAKPSNRIHIKDLTNCCISAMMKDKLSNIYNIGDGDHSNQTWFYKAVCHKVGINNPTEIEPAEAEMTWGAMRLSFLNESRRLNVNKMKKELIDNLKYPKAIDGIKESLPQEDAYAKKK